MKRIIIVFLATIVLLNISFAQKSILNILKKCEWVNEDFYKSKTYDYIKFYQNKIKHRQIVNIKEEVYYEKVVFGNHIKNILNYEKPINKNYSIKYTIIMHSDDRFSLYINENDNLKYVRTYIRCYD